MKDSSAIYALVMAGGRGTRFWPESTIKKPKQYLNLVGEDSMLRETLVRFGNLVAKERRYIVTVKEQEELARTCAEGEMAARGLIFEPSGRNTAPCILLGLAALLERGATEQDVVAIVPSDHVILNQSGFQNTVKKATQLALENQLLVTIGIPPHFPHTGFGYIQKGPSIGSGMTVKAFKEKPDRATAETYLTSGEYFWNAGMFVAPIHVLLREFEACSPETFQAFTPLRNSLEREVDLAKIYESMPEDSIDYAVMEKSQKVGVVPAEFDWNDLGSWDALEEVIKKTEGNTVAKAKHFYQIESKGNIVYAPEKMVSLIGVEDLIIVTNQDTLVVLPKSRSQEVKSIVNYLKEHKDLNGLL